MGSYGSTDKKEDDAPDAPVAPEETVCELMNGVCPADDVDDTGDDTTPTPPAAPPAETSCFEASVDGSLSMADIDSFKPAAGQESTFQYRCVVDAFLETDISIIENLSTPSILPNGASASQGTRYSMLNQLVWELFNENMMYRILSAHTAGYRKALADAILEWDHTADESSIQLFAEDAVTSILQKDTMTSGTLDAPDYYSFTMNALSMLRGAALDPTDSTGETYVDELLPKIEKILTNWGLVSTRDDCEDLLSSARTKDWKVCKALNPNEDTITEDMDFGDRLTDLAEALN